MATMAMLAVFLVLYTVPATQATFHLTPRFLDLKNLRKYDRRDVEHRHNNNNNNELEPRGQILTNRRQAMPFGTFNDVPRTNGILYDCLMAAKNKLLSQMSLHRSNPRLVTHKRLSNTLDDYADYVTSDRSADLTETALIVASEFGDTVDTNGDLWWQFEVPETNRRFINKQFSDFISQRTNAGIGGDGSSADESFSVADIMDSMGKRGHSNCDTSHVTLNTIIEYLRTGRVCGSRISHVRFGLGRK